MKLKTAIITILGLVLLSMFASHYYSSLQHRAILFRYVSDCIDGTMIQTMDRIVSELEHNSSSSIQKTLDKAKATHRFIESISFSYDMQKIAYSSNRALKSQKVNGDYRLVVNSIYKQLLSGETLFGYQIKYFDDDTQQHLGYILLKIDKEYLFKTIDQQALDAAVAMFLLQLLALVVVLLLSEWIYIKPIYRILESVKAGGGVAQKFFIKDFSLLHAKLVDSFWALNLQKQELEESLNETKYLDEILRTVADVNQLLLSSKNKDELLQKSCDRLSEFGHYKLVWIGFVDKGRIRIAYSSYDPTGYLNEDLNISLDPSDPTSKGPSARSVLENKPIVVDCLEIAQEFEPWRERAKKSGFRSSIALPICEDRYSKPFGVMGIYTDRVEGFEPKEINMLQELSGAIGFAIHSFNQSEAFNAHLVTDALTGLPNRTILFDEIETKTLPKVAIVNIDRFKDINEVYGFQFGDAVIKIYSEWLQEYTKNLENAKLFKLSGGEYAILFADETGDDEIMTFIEELIKESDNHSFYYEDIEIFINVTVGYAKTDTKAIEHAEMALKKAKAKNWHFMSFENSMLKTEEQKNNIIWHKTIKNAIENDRIIPYFQPIINNSSGLVEKYEALIRLKLSTGEIVPPFQFLEISKKMRLYPELTKIMATKTIETIKNSNLPVSINLSFDDIVEKNIQDFLFETIVNAGVGDRIIFEILESEGINSYEEVKAFIDKFRAIGCGFAIDDFGSGYSNFDHILKMQVDILKIDGSLIKNLPYDRNSQIIVKNINNFAKEMNIKTVAEFVCNEAVFLHVKKLGIDFSQGFYFFEPKPHLLR